MRHNVTVYKPIDRPNVEVQVDGRGWVPGEGRMRWQEDDGVWWLEVTFRSASDHSSEIDKFPADRVRLDTVDRSFGRSGS